jgi:ATP-dependent DNA helicase DinG
LHEIFGKGGALEEILPYYEYRDEQLKMAEYIDYSLSNEGNYLIEAGTGVGKTIAYLVPLIKRCIGEAKVVAVSTETKALQKQLIDKDIPLIKKVLKEKYNLDFRASLCLGSSNYPCLRKFEKMVQKGEFLFEEKLEVDLLKKYFEREEVFTIFDVEISNTLWNEIKRDSEFCNPYFCSYAKRCLFQKVKREWANSTLLVMNHYLFFSNVAIGKTFLPHFDYAVFDEAHALEQIASNQLGFELSMRSFQEISSSIYARDKKSLLAKISDKKKRERGLEIFFELEEEVENFFTHATGLMNESANNTLRLMKGFPEGEELLNVVKQMIDFLTTCEDQYEDEETQRALDVAKGRLFEFMQSSNMLVFGFDEDWVFWIQKNSYESDKHSALLKGQPINISEIMQSDVYSFYESSYFVSATLTVNNDFSFIQNKLGLNEAKTFQLNSPFDYENNVIVYTPGGHEPSKNGFVEKSCGVIEEVVRQFGGRCLLLFTSYYMLNQFYEMLTDKIENPIFAQGMMNPVQAVNEYKKTPGSILMGTHSFWQGLDLPGDLLKAVFIMRLPFAVPDRPDIEAKIEKCEQSGGNSFMQLQVPEAVIKFKQGFGRLIRGSNDSGVVAILDSRVITKRYGRIFLDSLPKCKMSSSLQDVSEFIEKQSEVMQEVST